MGSSEVILRSFTTTQSLDKVIYEVAFEDLQLVLRNVAAIEIEAQRSLGNPATSLLVDNTHSKDPALATKRVQAFFANFEDLRLAVHDAWAKIQSLTRVASGRAAASYQVWYKEQHIGNNPGAVDSYANKFNPATDYFRIVGPVLVYGRKIYWNPKGKPKFYKSVALRVPGVTVKLVRIKGVMRQAEESMRRKYRNLAITEDWVVTGALPTDGRTPGMWLGFKRKGSLLRS
jgi:hypothetical protein